MKIPSLAALIGAALFGPPAYAQKAPEAVTASGRVRGVAVDGVAAFKGIPFASAPVGPLRWRAPQPVASWTGVRDASAYGHDCMQKPVASDAAPLGTPPAEDCLYLNVWRPTATAAKRPVLVWIYGGGFLNGGASPPTYSGAELAKRGIVFVSFNYRVGRFGWFVHPQLTAEGAPGTAIGNYGFMDQIAVLNWVRQNIAAFGGDPANVTVVGESAGGASVHTLLTSPMAQGLFQKAVIQSGGDGKLLMTDVASAEKAGLTFAASKGIDAADPGALAKLRGLSAEQVTDGLSMSALFAKTDGPPTFTLPMVDGKVAVDAPSAYAADRFNHVPVMLGATSADLFGPDGAMIAGGRSMAKTFAAKGLPTYYYRFSYVAESAQADNPKGAAHASDIPFFFATLNAKYGTKTTARDRKMASATSGYLANFVKTGNPNGSGLTPWPRYDAVNAMMADFDAAGGVTGHVDR